MNALDGNDQIFDSRDVIDRIAELEAIEIIDREPDEQDELDALYEFEAEANSASDWQYGATFIADSYFEDYARDLADELGLIADDAHWPATCIDWERAAEELQVDYWTVDFHGTQYWVR